MDSHPLQDMFELQYSTSIPELVQSLPFWHCRRRNLVPPWQVLLQELQLPHSAQLAAVLRGMDEVEGEGEGEGKKVKYREGQECSQKDKREIQEGD